MVKCASAGASSFDTLKASPSLVISNFPASIITEPLPQSMPSLPAFMVMTGVAVAVRPTRNKSLVWKPSLAADKMFMLPLRTRM